MKNHSTHFINHTKLYKYYLNDLLDPLCIKLPPQKEKCVFLNPNIFIKFLHLNLLNKKFFMYNKGIIIFNKKTLINYLYKIHGNILANNILINNETDTDTEINFNIFEDKLEIFKDFFKLNFNLKYIKERENQLINNKEEICEAYFKNCNCSNCYCEEWEINKIINRHLIYKLEKHIAKKYNIKNKLLSDFKG